jgi:acetyl-CoA carboxylase biotin carboxyl carrier protein
MANEISNEDIREFVRLCVDSQVAEIEVQRGHNRVRIRRTLETAVQVQPMQTHSTHAAAPMMEQQHAGPSGTGHPPSPPPQQAVQPGPASNDVIVKSPIVGTYYDQAKPGDPPFVKVGDVVDAGHVLCIIESMKLMNEIESEVSGTVVAKLMENNRPVEYGEALFTIRPR